MMTVRRRVVSAFPALLLVLGGALVATPAGAAPPAGAGPENPWQRRHWPQTQPWQRAQPAAKTYPAGSPRPIDPQNYELPDTMTWDDYAPVPGTN